MKKATFLKTIVFCLIAGALCSCNTKPKREASNDTDSIMSNVQSTEVPSQEPTVNTEVPDEPEEVETTKPQTTALGPIDQVYEDCMGNPENQTTVGMCDCAASAQGAWDKQMNEYYSLLMSKLKEDEKEKLKISQQKWMVYRDAEFDFSGTTYYNMDGTMYRVMAVERQKEFVKVRALELKLYYSVFVEGE